MKISVLFILILFFNIGYAQNFVLNPGFEETDTINIKRTFENYICIKGWDFKVFDTYSYYLSKQSPINNFCYASKVNNGLNPRSGDVMAEISTLNYNLNSDKLQQNQSFIIGKLTKPLLKGKSYYFEMWYSLNWFGNCASSNIGVFFTDSVSFKKMNRTEIKPDLSSTCILYTNPAQWKKLSGEFVARSNSNLFVIGNFFTNECTNYVKIENPLKYFNKAEWDKLRNTTNICSYFLDDILVKPIVHSANDSTFGCENRFGNLKTGQTLLLNNINFEINKARLLNQSSIQLDELLAVLFEFPTIELEICGHTDRSGSEVYNQTLSENRAKAVYEYLVKKGIATNRLSYRGYGFQKPIAPNDNCENKAKNRRVEIKVTKR
jgi:outer membrane protein OmpA-like peptidoglycan-associated protein